jgi:DNA-binding response OmpR family regulator
MTRRSRILVIDDDPLFRSLIISVLRKDYLVSIAGEGAEGYYKALEHPPDIAVVDVQMPGWDGLKTLKSFRAHPALANVPVVMLTSDASKETVLAALNAGAIDYVIKTSFSKEEFLHKLERHLPGRPSPTIMHLDQSDAERGRPHPQPASEDAPVLQTARSAAGAEIAATAQPDGGANSRLQELIDDWE